MLGFEKGLGESCRRRWSFCREKGTLAVPACLLLVRSESQWADLVQLYIWPPGVHPAGTRRRPMLYWIECSPLHFHVCHTQLEPIQQLHSSTTYKRGRLDGKVRKLALASEKRTGEVSRQPAGIDITQQQLPVLCDSRSPYLKHNGRNLLVRSCILCSF